MYLRRSIVALCALPYLLFANEQIRFSVPSFPPYTYCESGEVKGTGVDKLRDILNRCNLSYELTITETYGRALHDMATKQSDGMFLATQNPARDTIAVFSLPVTFNNWTWYISDKYPERPDSSKFKAQARIGTILDTNTHKWLLKNNFNVTAPPPDIEHLVKMFASGRYDAIFIAEEVFENEARKQNISLASFKKHVQIKRPFGVYIAKHYLLKHPDTVNKLNNAISESQIIKNGLD